MNWQDLGRKVTAAGLPALGGALAGPAGASVGRAVADRIGAREADPSVLLQALQGDPEVALRLAELDLELEQERRKTLEVVLPAAAAEAASNEANVRAARQASDLNPTRKTMVYVTLGVLIFSLGALIAVEVRKEIPDMVLGLAVGIIGGLANQFQQMVAYFFGTSSGSAARAATIDRLSERKT